MRATSRATSGSAGDSGIRPSAPREMPDHAARDVDDDCGRCQHDDPAVEPPLCPTPPLPGPPGRVRGTGCGHHPVPRPVDPQPADPQPLDPWRAARLPASCSSVVVPHRCPRSQSAGVGPASPVAQGAARSRVEPRRACAPMRPQRPRRGSSRCARRSGTRVAHPGTGRCRSRRVPTSALRAAPRHRRPGSSRPRHRTARAMVSGASTTPR